MASLGAKRLQRIGARTTVVGIGNRCRGDDAAGPLLIDLLHERGAARCIDAGDAPERHLGEAVAETPTTILLVDAVDFGGEPGELAVFEPEELGGRAATPHTVPVATLAGYLRATSGAEVLLFGIQPGQVRFGAPMSEAVRDGVEAAARILTAQLGLQQASIGSSGVDAPTRDGRGRGQTAP